MRLCTAPVLSYGFCSRRSATASQSLIESPDALDSHPPDVCEDVSDAACLENVGDLPYESLMDSNDKLLGVYQDWVHQNPVAHMDGGIEEDSKWQER